MKATLLRISHLPDRTLGALVLESGDTFATLEPPWRDNLPNVSCIPQGIYNVIRHQSPSKGDCFKVLDVQGREDILFHVGNYPVDTKGCILVGFSRKGDMIQESKLGMVGLRAECPDGFDLRIIIA